MSLDFTCKSKDRKRLYSIVILLTMGLVAVIATAGILLGFFLFLIDISARSHMEAEPRPHPYQIYWALGATVVALIMVLVAWCNIRKLRKGGGRAIVESLGGKPVSPTSGDPSKRKLLNVTEEIAIASGLPVPRVYVLRDEPGIIAFAAGWEPSSAVLGVTRGAMELLTRDEIQGMVAHEFSHIDSSDMRLNIRLTGLISGIVFLDRMGNSIMDSWAPNSINPKNVFLRILGGLFAAVGMSGTFFAKCIRATVSRQREYLADAMALRFTRNPLGLAGALKKMGGFPMGSRMIHRNAESISHMFFGSGFQGLTDLFLATHPPLEERIRRLDSDFDREFPVVDETTRRLVASQDQALVLGPAARVVMEPDQGSAMQGMAEQPSHDGLVWATARTADSIRAATAMAQEAAQASSAAKAVVAALKNQAARIQGQGQEPGQALPGALHPQPDPMLAARGLIDSLPQEVRVASREADSAQAIVLGLLVLHDPRQDQALLDKLWELAEPSVMEALQELLPLVDQIQEHARLPLVDLCIPALRLLEEGKRKAFKATVQELVDADQETDPMEWALSRLLFRHLGGDSNPPRRKRPAVFTSLVPVQRECAVLLAVLARLGRDNMRGQEQAYAAGAQALGMPGLRPPSWNDRTLDNLDQALATLELLPEACKDHLLIACACCISEDQDITVSQGELLRVIADSLGRPMPPFA